MSKQNKLHSASNTGMLVPEHVRGGAPLQQHLHIHSLNLLRSSLARVCELEKGGNERKRSCQPKTHPKKHSHEQVVDAINETECAYLRKCVKGAEASPRNMQRGSNNAHLDSPQQIPLVPTQPRSCDGNGIEARQTYKNGD